VMILERISPKVSLRAVFGDRSLGAEPPSSRPKNPRKRGYKPHFALHFMRMVESFAYYQRICSFAHLLDCKFLML